MEKRTISFTKKTKLLLPQPEPVQPKKEVLQSVLMPRPQSAPTLEAAVLMSKWPEERIESALEREIGTKQVLFVPIFPSFSYSQTLNLKQLFLSSQMLVVFKVLKILLQLFE